MIKPILIFLTALVFAGCSAQSGEPVAGASVRVVLASEVKWEALNPARGEMSPKAGTLWGDRNGEAPTGFLAKFIDGFSSPPHIHNVTYRAVVIEGSIHNDDPEAVEMWMGNGSFWTQPKGETHITAAKGTTNIALVEIDQGPYLVRPPSQAYDSGERPVNVDASNVVWLPLPQGKDQVQDAFISYLWGNFGGSEWNGSFLKLAPGFKGVLKSGGSIFHSVVIRGSVKYGRNPIKNLSPGSYFGAQGATEHRIASGSDQETIIYIRTNGRYHLQQQD